MNNKSLIKELYHEAIRYEGSNPSGLLVRAGDTIQILQNQIDKLNEICVTCYNCGNDYEIQYTNEFKNKRICVDCCEGLGKEDLLI